LIAAITLLHYSTRLGAHHFHIFYQGLYFLPVLLAGLWFGLRGGVLASLSITILYLPFTVMHWNAFSSDDFNNLLEMTLYNLVAVILGVLRDREKKEQIRLRETDRWAAMGKAVSTLAHELKNPLVAIGGFSRLVKQHLPDNHPFRDKIDIIIEEGHRLEKMVREILDFSRPPNLKLKKEDIKGIMDLSLPIVSHLAERKNVGFFLEPPPHLPLISLDSERLRQAFINLLNAIDVSPEGIRSSCRSARGQPHGMLQTMAQEYRRVKGKRSFLLSLPQKSTEPVSDLRSSKILSKPTGAAWRSPTNPKKEQLSG
jgi:signal transduction histidine kinase